MKKYKKKHFELVLFLGKHAHSYLIFFSASTQIAVPITAEVRASWLNMGSQRRHIGSKRSCHQVTVEVGFLEQRMSPVVEKERVDYIKQTQQLKQYSHWKAVDGPIFLAALQSFPVQSKRMWRVVETSKNIKSKRSISVPLPAWLLLPQGI